MSARGTRAATKSSTVALGTATAFVVVAAILGLFVDDRPAIHAAGWTLRGSIAPPLETPPTPLPKAVLQPARRKLA